MEYLEFEKIDECPLEFANNYLKQGWTLIRCFVIKKKIGIGQDNETYTEQPFYVMGKPKSKT